MNWVVNYVLGRSLCVIWRICNFREKSTADEQIDACVQWTWYRERYQSEWHDMILRRRRQAPCATWLHSQSTNPNDTLSLGVITADTDKVKSMPNLPDTSALYSLILHAEFVKTRQKSFFAAGSHQPRYNNERRIHALQQLRRLRVGLGEDFRWTEWDAVWRDTRNVADISQLCTISLSSTSWHRMAYFCADVPLRNYSLTHSLTHSHLLDTLESLRGGLGLLPPTLPQLRSEIRVNVTSLINAVGGGR